MMTVADVDLEKGRGRRRSSEVEDRPAATRDSSGSTTGAHSDDGGSNLRKEKRRRQQQQQQQQQDGDADDEEDDDGETSSQHNDLVPAATVGEPSGEDIYGSTTRGRDTPTRTRSRASSNLSRALTIVPRASRRGLFGSLALVPEVERPHDYKNSTKWTITAAISLATAAAPMGSSIFYPALPALSGQLHASQTVANMSVALYMLSMSIFPLWWSSFSETLGRRTVYLGSFALFVVSSVLCAVSTSMPMLIVFRVCAGGASASVQAVGAGTIADIWESFERGRAMSLFYLGPLLGPLLAPIFGGVLAQELGWQSTMWFLAIYGLCCFLLLFLLLPETLLRRSNRTTRTGAAEEPEPEPEPPLSRMTTAESAKVHTKKLATLLRRLLIEPLSVLLFLRFPPVAITVLTAAIAFGALFVGNIAIQQSFSTPPYGYSQLVVGLLYAPPGLGYITASFFGGRWIDNIMAREARKANRYDERGRLILLPEDRMRENMWLANTVYPLSLLVFGWTLRYGIHWIAPSIAMFLFGVSSMLVFAAATTMLTEFVRKKSSAGVAINNFVRNILSCVGTVVASPWINATGVGWVFTAICIFCLVFGFLGIWMLRTNAQRWRKKMDEALEKL